MNTHTTHLSIVDAQLAAFGAVLVAAIVSEEIFRTDTLTTHTYTFILSPTQKPFETWTTEVVALAELSADVFL